MIAAFVERWSGSVGAERVNHQLFPGDACAILGLPAPGDHAFGCPVARCHPDGSAGQGRIDLHKRDRFVLGAKRKVDRKLAEQSPPLGATPKGTSRLDAAVLEGASAPIPPRSAARSPKGARPAQMADVLHTLDALDQARAAGGALRGLARPAPTWRRSRAGPRPLSNPLRPMITLDEVHPRRDLAEARQHRHQAPTPRP